MGASSSNNLKNNEQKMTAYSRQALHAGSWYESNREALDDTLSTFLNKTMISSSSSEPPEPPLRAIICPHAGYSYSGPTAAFSYAHLQQEIARNNAVTSILVLHPSHHVYLDGCAISGASQLETPVGNLQVDTSLRNEVLALGNYSIMQQRVDEREHSSEMQYPFIAKALGPKISTVRVLPIMVGNLSAKSEKAYGELLAPIVARSNVICVISSDFMHWGSRFQYQPTPTTMSMEIYQHIQELDHQGMNLIELQEPGAFATYLKKTQNTICGRHPIGLWLNSVHTNKNSAENLEIKFVKYDQSSKVKKLRDSSVSYASATARKVS
jgi:hypothetical protein